MELKPLEQWICDTCGEIIEKPNDGYVQFNLDANKKYNDFIIVHHKGASPLSDGKKKGCYVYDLDQNLTGYIGHNGVVNLLSRLYPLANYYSEKELPVSDIKKWIDFFKRLQLPYYEEARQYFNEALEDGYITSIDEVAILQPYDLKELIMRYGK